MSYHDWQESNLCRTITIHTLAAQLLPNGEPYSRKQRCKLVDLFIKNIPDVGSLVVGILVVGL